MSGPLEGLRVLEMAPGIPGAYCTKLLVDLGAEVTKIELPGGDPLRHWGPFPSRTPDPERSGLFEYLNAGKKGGVLDPDSASDRETATRLLEGADVLIDGFNPGAAERWRLKESTRGRSTALVVVRISDFGQGAPSAGVATTPLTMQAAGGWVTYKDRDRPPVQAGGRIPEYVVGAYATLAALTALRIPTGSSHETIDVDLSVLESLISTLPYPMVVAERMRSLGLPTSTRAAPLLGTMAAADGWIGINCLTGQHFVDLCSMVGLPEFSEHQIAIMLGGPERDEFFTKVNVWLGERKVDEILDLSQAMRIPASPVTDGATIFDVPQYRDRSFFVAGGGDDWTFRRPGSPFRFSATENHAAGKAPSLAPLQPVQTNRTFTRTAPESASDVSPLSGIRVIDLTTYWAGGYLTCYLGALGADVIKVESIRRPDGFRFTGAFVNEGQDWERSPLWCSANLNKRDVTLDLTTEPGLKSLRTLIATADVVVENFSPRVVENFGLDYDELIKVNPDVIMVRMPGFGLEGPWRDYVGWAPNIEQTSGMATITGYPDGPPCSLMGPADPIVGIHGAIALLAALEHRRSTGEGQLVELAQIEVGACLNPEPVLEYSINGRIQTREGNRCRGFAQGVYPTVEDETWIALSVRDDSELGQLLDAMDADDDLRDDPDFRSLAACEAAHDRFDHVVTRWTTTLKGATVCEALNRRGIPAAIVATAESMYDEPNLRARDFYTDLERNVTGVARYPGWPFRITPGPKRHHRTGAPTLGQHNTEILSSIGLTELEIDTLRTEGVIGDRLASG